MRKGFGRFIRKGGGIACFLIATWMLWSVVESPLPTIQGYLVMILLAISLYPLAVLGLVGARFGTILYDIAGLTLISYGVLEVLFFSWAFLTEPRKPEPWIAALLLPFLLMFGLVIAGVKVMDRGFHHHAAKDLLKNWSIGAVLSLDEVKKMLLTYYGEVKKIQKPERFIYKDSDAILRLMVEQGYVRQEERTSLTDALKYKRIR